MALEALDRLTRRLRTLLAQLETPDGDAGSGAPAWTATWRTLGEDFEAWQRQAPDLAALPPEDRLEVARRLEETLRLHAVVTSLVARQTRAVSAGIDRLADARRRLRAATPRREALGGSCDVRG